MIDLGKIPTFTGDLATLETHAASLKTTASSIRGTGKDVHEAFQALDPVYDAPEQEELLDSTIPVRDKADAFATKLESVSGALASFATTARPLVNRMNQLRADAEKFVADNKDDDDWQQDQDKIDENERLVDEVGTTWVAFQGVERDAANKITALVGGTRFVVDDGSHKAGMYGFRESDVKDAKETPWGTVDEREYTGLRAAWEWTKDNVGGALKGFFVDGVWGTIKGLGSMINVFDWDNFKTTWSGIGDVFGGISAYIMTPYDWAMDKMFGPVDHSDTDKQKAALRNFGKSLVAWDEWGKDPSRAFGTVLFNTVTIGSGSLLKLGKAGKLTVGAEAVTAVGKAGALVDPMSYLGKAAGVTKIKVGDLLESLKTSRAGVDDMARTMPAGTGTSPHPGEVATPPGLAYVDHAGNTRVVGDDAVIRDEHGNVVPDTEAVPEPHKNDLSSTNETVPEREKVLEGAGGPGRVENSVNQPTGPAHPGDGSNGTDGRPHDSAGHATGGHTGIQGSGPGHGSGAPDTAAGRHNDLPPRNGGGDTPGHGGEGTSEHHGDGEDSTPGHDGDGDDSTSEHHGDGEDSTPGHDGDGDDSTSEHHGDGEDSTPGHDGDGDEGAESGAGEHEPPVNNHPLGTPENPHPVTEAQLADYMKSKSELEGLSRKKQIDAVGRGIEVNGQKYKPEAPLLKGAKHGIDWTEGPARASKEAKPQGKFGTPADVQYATERAADLGPGKTGFFKLPEGHSCIEYMPNGKTRVPNTLFVKVYPNGKVHAYPTTR